MAATQPMRYSDEEHSVAFDHLHRISHCDKRGRLDGQLNRTHVVFLP